VTGCSEVGEAAGLLGVQGNQVENLYGADGLLGYH
jgi:hypothetical protein